MNWDDILQRIKDHVNEQIQQAEKDMRIDTLRRCQLICLQTGCDAAADEIAQIIHALEFPESTRG